jgi:hypothetical protein
MGVPWLVANDLLTTLRMPTPARNTSVPCISGNRLWIPELLLRFTITTVKLGELVGLHRDDLQQRRRHHHSAAMATGTEKSGVKGFLVGLTKMTLVTVVCGCFLCADWFVLDSFLSPEGVRYRLLEAHRPSFGVRLLEGLLAQLGTYDLCGAPV